MKNKKSKFVVPALVLIGLSTAASVSGSVAWFTAARSTKVTTGQFAVVKTGDNLGVDLGDRVGVTTNDTNRTIFPTGNNALTDSSFNHTDAAGPYVVKPNVPRNKVLSISRLSSNTLETDLSRGTNVYSAFVWDMTFSITFSAAATFDQGLYLDLASDDTYMHGAITISTEGAPIGGLFTTPACDGTALAQDATHPNSNPVTYYYKQPNHAGKGFRIAIIPTTIPSGSKGYAKVWAENETGASNEGKYVSGGENADLTGNNAAVTAYSEKTVCLSGSSYSVVENPAEGDPICAGSYMNSSDTSLGVPADNTAGLNDAYALANQKNYLGMFKCSAANAPSRVVELTFTCVAWYDGTHPEVADDNNDGVELETMVSSLQFGVTNFVTGI